jgi:TonB family protein
MICSMPDRPASIVRVATVQPVGKAARQRYAIAVPISIYLDAQGKPTSIRVVQPTGRADVDRAAEDIARKSMYAPKIADCVAKPGTFTYVAQVPTYLAAYEPPPQAMVIIDHFCVPPRCQVPTPTPIPCTREATITYAEPTDYPSAALRRNTGPQTALVYVTIGQDGKPLRESIYSGTGTPELDREALRAAQASKYTPKYVNCRAVTGTYIFRAEFSPP